MVNRYLVKMLTNKVLKPFEVLIAAGKKNPSK